MKAQWATDEVYLKIVLCVCVCYCELHVCSYIWLVGSIDHLQTNQLGPNRPD